MKIGMLENTSIISKLIDVKVVTRSRQTSERPISDYYYIIFIFALWFLCFIPFQLFLNFILIVFFLKKLKTFFSGIELEFL
jgi:hypothetical protein